MLLLVGADTISNIVLTGAVIFIFTLYAGVIAVAGVYEYKELQKKR